MLRYQDFSLGINKNPDINFGLDVSGNIQVSGDILPATNIESDLGSTTKRFRDIYLSGNTIDLDGTKIQKEVGGGIKIADASGNTLDGKFNNIDISGNTTISGIINQVVQLDVSGSILPTRNLVYDLGAPDKRWNDLYLSGNTIDLSGTLLSRHTDGSLMVHDSNNNMVNLRANNIIAEGNLTVSGTTTTVNSTTVTVQDPIITLGSDVSNNKDKGIEFKYGDSKIGFFGYDDSTGNLTFLKDASNNSEVFTGTQGTIEGLAFKSTVGSGTAPLTVISTTVVSNLNADLLEGLNPSQFMRTDVDTSTTGNIGIGTIIPQAALHVQSTGAMIVPVGTDAQLPTTPLVGMLRYNLTSNRLQFYNGTSWNSIGGVSATGGTITEINGYRIHTFTSSGTFTMISGGNIEYLVVAGGGGGGGRIGGGGGAGGYRSSVQGESSGAGVSAEIIISLASNSYSVVIGGGGTGSGGTGSSGQNSSFGTIISLGGGGGAGTDGYSGLNGGSGGGGGRYGNGPGGTGTVGQGYGGGTGTAPAANPDRSGGGGGAGSAGANGITSGNGGSGITSYITGIAVGRAGGGAGNAIGTADAGTATNGGASATKGVIGNNGTVNTGGGGSGGGYTGEPGLLGGNGGSGIVIIRYLL